MEDAMKINVLHDQQGGIIAISKIGDLQEAGSKFTKVGMIAGQGQHLLEVELSGEEERKSLLELHNKYRVEPATLKLVKKP
jgi:hypothetical protein